MGLIFGRGGIGRRGRFRRGTLRVQVPLPTFRYEWFLWAINLAAKWLAYTEQMVVRFRHCPFLKIYGE